MTPRPPKARPKPLYVVVNREGVPCVGLVEQRRKWLASQVRREGLLSKGDRIVKYVPEIRPTARGGK